MIRLEVNNPMPNDTTAVHKVSQHEHQGNFFYSTENVSPFSYDLYIDAGYGRSIPMQNDTIS
jgi:hypothetical protein